MQNYAESEHLSEIITEKEATAIEMLFVPTPNPAGFIHMCLLVISLFSVNPTKQVFSVFPLLGLQSQFANKHRVARAVHSKGVSPCKAHRIMSSLCKTIKKEKKCWLNGKRR